MREDKKRKRSAVDWSNGLPADLLTLIADNIHSLAHKIAIAAVCRSWHNVFASYPITETTPWLMLSPKQDSASRSFYRFGSGQVFDIEFPPEINGRRCWGSPFGWLIAYDVNIDDMKLYNPLSRASIPLPKLFPYFANKYSGYKFVRRPRFLEKAILTASPDSPHCMVIVIPSMYEFDETVYAKPRDIVWSDISWANLADVVSFRGKFFGCNWQTGNIVTLDFETDFSNQLILKRFADAPPQMIQRATVVALLDYYRKKYLVDVGGELHLVLRYVKHSVSAPNFGDYYLTYDFEIYKIDFSTKDWKLIKCLEDHCLFVGDNNAYAVPISFDHEREACGDGISLKPNCIYFLDDKAFGKKSDGSDIGVFHLGEKYFGARPLGENAGFLFHGYVGVYLNHSLQPFMLKTLASGLYSDSCPPLWITPYLRFREPSYNGDHHPIEAKDKKLSTRKVGPFMTLKPDSRDEERRKLIFQLKNQFTYTEKHGVNRKPWIIPF